MKTAAHGTAGLQVAHGIAPWLEADVFAWFQANRHRLADNSMPREFAEFLAYWRQLRRVGNWTVTVDGVAVGAFFTVAIHRGTVQVVAVFAPDRWGTEAVRESLLIVLDRIFRSSIETVIGCVFNDDQEFLALGEAVGAERDETQRYEMERAGQRVPIVVLSLTKNRFLEMTGERAA